MMLKAKWGMDSWHYQKMFTVEKVNIFVACNDFITFIATNNLQRI